MTTTGGSSVDLLPALLATLIDLVLLKGTVLVLLGLGASYALGSRSAARRHAVWAAVMLGLLLAPSLRTISPTWTGSALVTVRPPAPMARPVSVPATERTAPVVERAARTLGTVLPTAAPVPSASPVTVRVGTWYTVVVQVWVGGVVLLLALLAGALVRAARLRARATPAPASVQRRAAAAAARLGLRRTPAVLTSDELDVPGAMSLGRPCVVLPDASSSWSEERLDAVLLHEISHVRRRDFAIHLFARAARAVYWPNPAVWLAERRLAHERELACDDRAVEHQANAVAYAEHLVQFARSVRRPMAAPAAVHLLGRSSLAVRVRSLLDDARSRTPASRRWMAGMACLTMAVAIPLAGVEILAVGQVPGNAASHVDRLRDADPLVRRSAAWALGEREEPVGLEGLEAALADPDFRVQMMAAWALGEIKAPSSAPALVAALDDDHPGVREMAVLALGELRDPSVEDVIRRARTDRELQASATWALAELADRDPAPVWAGRMYGEPARTEDVSTYLVELGHPDAVARARAAEKLGRAGDPVAVEPLMDLLEDPDPAVRAMAVWALDEINPTRSAFQPTR